MTEPKRVVLSYDVDFYCETCGMTQEVRGANSLLQSKKEAQSHEEMGHALSVSYATVYLEEDPYTGKHSLSGGL